MSGGYDSFGGLSSPRRVMVPVLVRDGKPCHTGMVPTSPHGSYAAIQGHTETYSSASANGRLPSYSGENSSYSATSPTSGTHLGSNGLSMTYSTSSPSSFHPQSQTIDHYNSHTFSHHNQLGAQQFGSTYAPAAYGPAYAMAATYSANYRPHQIQQKWPAW